jgi:cytochrome c oxidase assembly protein subunit 15
MADLRPTPAAAAPSPRPSPAGRGGRSLPLHRFAVITVLATLALIFAGGLVTSTESGLSVPDWPLSYGQLMPPMVGGVRYEHGHRMVASAVGILTIVLAVWLSRREPRRWVRRLGWLALGAVVAQGVLGGLTVLLLLPTGVSVAHACLAQTFFCLIVTIAVVTSPRWERGRDTESVTRLAAFTASAVFLQLLLGAVMRHTKAGLAIPDFPLSLGRVIPPLDSFPVAIAFAHRAWGILVAVLVLVTAAAAFRTRRAGLTRAALALALIVVAQVALGAVTVLSHKNVAVTTAHVATGALLLGTVVAIAVGSLSRRRFVAVPSPGADAKVLAGKA